MYYFAIHINKKYDTHGNHYGYIKSKPLGLHRDGSYLLPTFPRLNSLLPPPQVEAARPRPRVGARVVDRRLGNHEGGRQVAADVRRGAARDRMLAERRRPGVAAMARRTFSPSISRPNTE